MISLIFSLSLIACTVYYHAVYKKTLPNILKRGYHISYMIKSSFLIYALTLFTYYCVEGFTLRSASLCFTIFILICLEIFAIRLGKKESEKERFMAELSGEYYGV